MKKKIITIALITITSFANQLVAQETAVLKTRTKSNQCNERVAGYDVKKNIKCRVIPTETGCTIAFDNVISTSSVAGISGGVVAGKKGYDSYKSMSCFSVSSADNSVSIVSPRDPASGLPTGKRMHKPFVITKELDKSSSSAPSSEIAIDEPGVHKVSSDAVEGYDLKAAKKIAARVAGGSSDSPPSEISVDEPGVGISSERTRGRATLSDFTFHKTAKATFKEFTVIKRCDGKTTKIVCSSGECEIPLDDCPNGTCDLVCSFSWGVSNSGSMSSGSGAGSGRCAAGFSLEIQDGACTAISKKDVQLSSYDLSTGKK